MSLARELKRLTKHTAIYGVGGLVSRILAIILLPLYTHYLPPEAYGQVEIITAAVAILAILLQMGISSAFFRFYFDEKEVAGKLVVVRTSFWFTMAMATTGLAIGLIFATPISHLLGLGDDPTLVMAGAVGLWAQTNYQQLTSLFRVEERSTAYAIASVINVLITVVAMVLFVAIFHWGAVGLVVGNFIGTLIVYFGLLIYRSEQLGLQFDRRLLRSMQRFGMPLVPSALALWTINFVDRRFVVYYKGLSEAGVYSAAIKVASVVAFVMFAFRTAWPAFAYSIEDDKQARRTYAFVLTYLVTLASWMSLGLGALSPWIVPLLTSPDYSRAQEGVALLAFAFTAYAGYTVLAIGSGRARKTGFNWIVTGAGAAVNVVLNIILIPRYGMVGACVATLISYVVLFAGMAFYAQRVFPIPHQWRRVATAVGVAVGLNIAARGAGLGFIPSLLVVAIYPVLLFPLGYFHHAELTRLRRLVPGW